MDLSMNNRYSTENSKSKRRVLEQVVKSVQS